jgi:nickel transport system ATP-binding protein
MGEFLRLHHINKVFRSSSLFGIGRRVYAAKEINLSINKGECLGLVGESGSGKSTLGRIILGLERPDSGQVIFQGVNIYGKDGQALQAVRRDLQVVFQDCFSSVNPRLKAGEIIAEPIRNFERMSHRQEQQMVEELLAMVGLRAKDAQKLPHQFSGGQLQRVCIARAIALRPKMIVFDEAVSSLDVQVQAQILDLLWDLKQELNISYLFISHNLQAVAQLADRLVVMCQGEIVERLDDMSQIRSLTHPVSQSLLAAVLSAHPGYRQDLERYKLDMGAAVTALAYDNQVSAVFGSH